SLVEVGDTSVFMPALRADNPNLEAIDASNLNLDSPSLR
ncbi:MAG: hypothetical protein JWQ52_1868, partial [Phenylobacterium sp.]|nr:hypothetical protein [Phenylobacterium sp.]